MENCVVIILLKRLVVVLVFFGIVGGTNVFGAQALRDNAENLWTGEWQSSNYKTIRGKLSARIPSKIPLDRQFSVKVDIKYHPESFYKSGKTVKVVFEGLMTRNGRVNGDGNANIDKETNRKLSLKGRPAWSFQVIEYEALIHEKKDVIVGTYRAKWPSDQGDFTLYLVKH